MATYSRLQTNAYEKMAFNAGMVLIGSTAFTPSTGVVDESKILGASSGGWSFNAGINTSDLAEDVDNARPGMKQFLRFSHSEPHLTGTLLTFDQTSINLIQPGSTVAKDSTSQVVTATPHGYFTDSDFYDLWLITDYSTITNVSGTATSGFFALKLKNCLNVSGAQLQTSEDGKMTMPVDFRAFYDADNATEEPYEIYFKANAST